MALHITSIPGNWGRTACTGTALSAAYGWFQAGGISSRIRGGAKQEAKHYGEAGDEPAREDERGGQAVRVNAGWCIRTTANSDLIIGARISNPIARI